MNRLVPLLLHYLPWSWVLLLGCLPGTKAEAQGIDFGKSYVNLTKGNNGGTIETGDVLEIRASFVVRSGTYDSCAFFDTIPTGTAYMPGTIRVLTNEGKIYKQFTDRAGDDEGWITGNQFVRINLGYNQSSNPARWFRRGRVAYNHRPSFYGSTCIMIASYQVRVTADLNTTIRTGGGAFTYRSGSAALARYLFPANTVMVFPNYGMCSNSVGTNALGTEFNGTFGTGKARNRTTTSANVPVGYTFAQFAASAPQDYYYGIANNTSINTGYTTLNTWPKPDNARRVFGVWDIIGDHTGAPDPFAGNPAADTVANPNAGYMLVINAAYRIDSAFQQTITNLCPNTYYEISAWVRNICSRCGCDSAGRGAGTSGYIPTAPGDSSGVYPNITFDINGIDYYTTGNLLYTGKWVKKGFVFRTGPNQTSFTLKLFNNAPGGGGNDWALDDISVATCSPDLTFTPESDPVFCQNNVVSLGSRVRSFFDNYTEYKWQRSTDGGISWTATPVSGSATPEQVNGAWEYHVSYPQFVGTRSDSGHKYRMVVATTPANLANSGCAFYGNTSVLTLNIEHCQVLDSRIKWFAATAAGNQARLRWQIDQEQFAHRFVVERSTDGQHFATAGELPVANKPIFEWKEPLPDGTAYYRIRIVTLNGKELYSDIAMLQGKGDFSVQAANPFGQELVANVHLPAAGRVAVLLTDGSGRIVQQQLTLLPAGTQRLAIPANALPDGFYLLSVTYSGKTIHQKMIKGYVR